MSLALSRCTRASSSTTLFLSRAASTKTKQAPKDNAKKSVWQDAKDRAKEVAKAPKKSIQKKAATLGSYVPPVKSEMDQILFAQRMNPSTDFNAMSFHLLDVAIPHDLFAKTRGSDPIASLVSKIMSQLRRKKTETISDAYLTTSWMNYLSPVWLWKWVRDPVLRKQAEENRTNRLKNIFCLYQCAVIETFNSVDTSKQGVWHVLTRWSRPLLTATHPNTKSKWLNAWKAEAIDSYFGMMTAVSNRDEKMLKALTANSVQTSCLRQLKALNSVLVYKWNGNEETHPPFATILSVRVASAYTGAVDPVEGNRLLVQLGVQFETWQSLTVEDSRGKVLSKTEPKKVINYFVLERKMWYKSPWIIREELYPNIKAVLQAPTKDRMFE